MSIYANARRDERIREYLPVKRILWQSGCSGAEIMPGNLDLQPRVAGPMSKIRIAKGGGILLDFGIELHGGVRLLCCRKGRARLRFGESASEAMGTPDQDHAIHNTVLDLPAMGMLEYGNTAFRFVRIDAVGGALVAAAALTLFAARNDFGLGRNMEITVNMMRALSLEYVDEVRSMKRLPRDLVQQEG